MREEGSASPESSRGPGDPGHGQGREVWHPVCRHGGGQTKEDTARSSWTLLFLTPQKPPCWASPGVERGKPVEGDTPVQVRVTPSYMKAQNTLSKTINAVLQLETEAGGEEAQRGVRRQCVLWGGMPPPGGQTAGSAKGLCPGSLQRRPAPRSRSRPLPLLPWDADVFAAEFRSKHREETLPRKTATW